MAVISSGEINGCWLEMGTCLCVSLFEIKNPLFQKLLGIFKWQVCHCYHGKLCQWAQTFPLLDKNLIEQDSFALKQHVFVVFNVSWYVVITINRLYFEKTVAYNG